MFRVRLLNIILASRIVQVPSCELPSSRTHERFACYICHIVSHTQLRQRFQWKLSVRKVRIREIFRIQDTGRKVRSRCHGISQTGTVHAGIFQRGSAQIGIIEIRIDKIRLIKTTALQIASSEIRSFRNDYTENVSGESQMKKIDLFFCQRTLCEILPLVISFRKVLPTDINSSKVQATTRYGEGYWCQHRPKGGCTPKSEWSVRHVLPGCVRLMFRRECLGQSGQDNNKTK